MALKEVFRNQHILVYPFCCGHLPNILPLMMDRGPLKVNLTTWNVFQVWGKEDKTGSPTFQSAPWGINSEGYWVAFANVEWRCGEMMSCGRLSKNFLVSVEWYGNYMDSLARAKYCNLQVAHAQNPGWSQFHVGPSHTNHSAKGKAASTMVNTAEMPTDTETSYSFPCNHRFVSQVASFSYLWNTHWTANQWSWFNWILVYVWHTAEASRAQVVTLRKPRCLHGTVKEKL